MNYRTVLSPGAKADMRSARRWYRRIDPNLAFQFSLEGQRVVQRIAQFPYLFSLVNAKIRRARLKRFPYAMYYELDSDLASVMAVIHQRRSDDAWRQRSHRDLQ